VKNFRHLRTTVTNQNFIHEGIKIRLNSGNACYHSIQNVLSYLLPKNAKIKTYKTTIIPVVLYGCETWSLTLREGLRMSENIQEVKKKTTLEKIASSPCTPRQI
jgi:hypothetical protein